MSKLLQIAILSRDRADFLKEAVDSALMQSGSELDYEIIISDNSEKDDVNKLVNKYYLTNKKIKYIRRNPTLSDLYLHCELVISEFNSKYAVIFHDDDILHPDYIEKMTPLLSNESIVSVGCNAKIFNNNIIDSTKRMHNFNSLKIFNSKKDFLQQYLLGYGGVAPFPGYIYKTKFIQKIAFNSLICGKHRDVSFLTSLLDYGSVAWLPDEVMYYRVHLKSDSASEAVTDRLHLLRYMFSEGIDRDSMPVFLFRYLFWLNWMKQQGRFLSNISKWNYKIVIRFLVFKFFKVLLSSYLWNTIRKKIKIKINLK